MPYFFSDLSEPGYGQWAKIDSGLETVSAWQKPHDTAVVYYLCEGRVRGVMTCNVREKAEAALELIRRGAGAGDRL